MDESILSGRNCRGNLARGLFIAVPDIDLLKYIDAKLNYKNKHRFSILDTKHTTAMNTKTTDAFMNQTSKSQQIKFPMIIGRAKEKKI